MISMLKEYLQYLYEQVHYSIKSIPPDLLVFLMKSDTDNPTGDPRKYFNRIATLSRWRVKELEKDIIKSRNNPAERNSVPSLISAVNFIKSKNLLWIHTVGEIEFWFSISDKNVYLWNMEQGKFIGSEQYKKWMTDIGKNFYGT